MVWWECAGEGWVMGAVVMMGRVWETALEVNKHDTALRRAALQRRAELLRAVQAA